MHHRRNDTRRRNPQSVMVWAAVTATGRSPLLFVLSGVELNSQRHSADIIEGCLLPLANQHFQGQPWTLQQDSAPSHGSKLTQSWIQREVPSFISKEDWPARSPDLNPLDYSICSIFNGHVGRRIDGFEGVLGGYGIGKYNVEGRRLLEFCDKKELCVANMIHGLKRSREE